MPSLSNCDAFIWASAHNNKDCLSVALFEFNSPKLFIWLTVDESVSRCLIREARKFSNSLVLANSAAGHPDSPEDPRSFIPPRWQALLPQENSTLEQLEPLVPLTIVPNFIDNSASLSIISVVGRVVLSILVVSPLGIAQKKSSL